MIKKTVTIDIQNKNANGGTIIISTGGLDRANDRVMPMGGRFQSYLANPVVQYGHIYNAPWATVGRTTSLAATDQDITVDFELRPAANESDPQNIVLLLWEGEWIKSASVGFLPLKSEPNEAGGLDFTEWELLEWSLIPIPANAEAMRLAVKALDTDTVVDADLSPIPDDAFQRALEVASTPEESDAPVAVEPPGDTEPISDDTEPTTDDFEPDDDTKALIEAVELYVSIVEKIIRGEKNG